MADQWPKGSSPTGRGYTQGSDSYRADDVERMCREEEAFQERKRQAIPRWDATPFQQACIWAGFLGAIWLGCHLHGVIVETASHML